MSQDRFDRLEDKMDSMKVEIKELAIKTAENTISLQQHMEQTILVRQQNEMLREYIDTVKDTAIKELKIHQETDDKFHKSVDQDRNRIKNLLWSFGIIISGLATISQMERITAFISNITHLTH